jgi:cell fate regulator YaaT (PSP1 superfamily)
VDSSEKELQHLEDKDIEVKRKKKKDHKLDPNDTIYRVKLTYNNYSKMVHMDQNDIKRGTFLIIPTQYGPEIGIVQGIVQDKDDIQSEDEIAKVIRVAGEKDRKKFSDNLQKEKEAFKITVEKIKEHRLDMKLINVHYFLEDSKILFNFTADGRIDFRELVKDLASIFKTRIELRQIGVRDECRILHGYGQCGRHFCCSDVNNELAPITIKMAKEQNITLNSMKISGSCGRLLCCLAYEADTYTQEKKRFPAEGAKIFVGNDKYFVAEVNIQTSMVKIVSVENSRYHFVHADKINYNKERREGRITEKIDT